MVGEISGDQKGLAVAVQPERHVAGRVAERLNRFNTRHHAVTALDQRRLFGQRCDLGIKAFIACPQWSNSTKPVT